jgi:general secretion pathway protein G
MRAAYGCARPLPHEQERLTHEPPLPHQRAGVRVRAFSTGFTLIELLVVMAVLGLLALAVYPLAELNVRRERERELKQALWQIREAIDAYKRAADAGQITGAANRTGYPPSLQALVQGTGAAAASGQPLYFLRRLPRDPFADPALPAEASWGLRSFASPPDQPRPGDDVYDVYSRASGTGLNGVPLRDW